MKIDGNNLSTYGLKLVRKDGFFDMPSRIQPFTYDWGDQIDPLVEPEDIFFQSQLFRADVVHDPKIGSTPQGVITALEALEEINVEIEGKTGGVGEYLCQVQNVVLNKEVSTLQKMTINFYHRVPLFPAALPSPGSLGSSHFGGFNFSQFGIKVSSVKDFNSLNSLFSSKETTFQTGSKLSGERRLKRISITCYLVGSSQADRLQKMESFKTLLSQDGLQTLTHGGMTFSTFHTDGFKTKLIGNKALTFTFNLNVVP